MSLASDPAVRRGAPAFVRCCRTDQTATVSGQSACIFYTSQPFMEARSHDPGSVPVVGVGLGRKQLAAAALCWLRSSCSPQRGRTTMYRDHDAGASF